MKALLRINQLNESMPRNRRSSQEATTLGDRRPQEASLTMKDGLATLEKAVPSVEIKTVQSREDLKTALRALSPESSAFRSAQRALLGSGQAFYVDQDSGQKYCLLKSGEKLLGGVSNIDLLFAKISEAELNASQQASGKELVLVIGKTGAGKSTLINYLVGCQMESSLSPGHLTADISAVDEIMEIGHGRASQTEHPKAHFDEESGLCYCDCPGFDDNRGPETDIANAFGIKSITRHAASVRAVVVLVNYHTLKADRAVGLADTIKTTRALFSNQITDHIPSIRLVVTKAPIEGTDALDLGRLREFLLLQNDPIINDLLPHLMIYNPLGQGGDELGNSDREAIIESLQQCPGVENAESVFSPALGTASDLALTEYGNQTKDRINQSLEAGNYLDVRLRLKTLARLAELGFRKAAEAHWQANYLIRDWIASLSAHNTNRETLEVMNLVLTHFSRAIDIALELIDNREKRLQAEVGKAEAAGRRADAERLRADAEVARANALAALAKELDKSWWERLWS